MKSVDPRVRFREARERLGLSPDEVAAISGISPNVWDIESHGGDLESCYSPIELKKLCLVLQIRPNELFGDDVVESAVSAEELVQRIHSECQTRGIMLEQFEDVVGWRLSVCIDTPMKLLEDLSLDGLQWLCRELHIDWRRVLLSL